MEQYDDADATRERSLDNRRVLAFVAAYWSRRRLMLAATVALYLVAILFELAAPRAAQQLVEAALPGPSNAAAAWRAWGMFVGVYVAFYVIRNLAIRVWNPLSAATMKEIIDEGFARVQSFSSDWHAATFGGATVRRLSRAMWGYDVVADATFIWIGPALVVLVGMSVQLMTRWLGVGLFSLAMVGLYIASNIAVSAFYVRKANLRSVALDSRIGGAMADAISSNPAVKSFGAEAREEARIARVTADWRAATVKTWNRYADSWLLHNLLMAAMQAGLTGLLLLRWTHGEAGAGDVAFVITTFLVMSGYLRNIGDNIRMLQRGLADIEDAARFALTPPQIADAPQAPPLRPDAGAIRFERVRFQYAGADRPLFEDLDLTIEPGQTVALVGATGSGKSTLIKLLQRLHDLRDGRILIDGQDIARVSQTSLRRAVAVVPQDPALFHRSIAENIAYGAPDADARQIARAAEQARAAGFIERLPEGYATLVGERGVKLSGGERQRVAIARAFLADAPILVLDEATSSLDVETEAEVQAATEALMRGRTTLIIAHRLSTVRGADRILVFESGKVIESGDHRSLLAQGGAYARLHAVTIGV